MTDPTPYDGHPVYDDLDYGEQTGWHVCMSSLDLVGISEIADRLNVRRSTVDNWRHTRQLPAPRWTVSGRPVWEWTLDIEPWARQAGKLT